MIEDMAQVHMSEAEVAKNFAAALEKVRQQFLDDLLAGMPVHPVRHASGLVDRAALKQGALSRRCQ